MIEKGGVIITKTKLIKMIAKKSKISQKSAHIAFDVFVNTVTQALKKGDKVSLLSFGTFSVAKRKARIARNPRTGETIRVPARKAPKFKAGKEMIRAVK